MEEWLRKAVETVTPHPEGQPVKLFDFSNTSGPE